MGAAINLVMRPPLSGQTQHADAYAHDANPVWFRFKTARWL
jgi:hypothetical protein